MDQQVLKYGLRPTVRLANNVTPFQSIFTLKQDDPDGHAKAISDMIGTQDFADHISNMAIIHIFAITRINHNQILFMTNFDCDVVTYFESFAELEEPVRAILDHFEDAPTREEEFTKILEYFAACQVDVIAYYCAYPELTVNQIRRDADWRTKVIEMQKSLAQPAGKAAWGQSVSAL